MRLLGPRSFGPDGYWINLTTKGTAMSATVTEQKKSPKMSPKISPKPDEMGHLPIYLGQIVLWHTERGGPPVAPALVTKVGHCTLSLAVFFPENMSADIRDGVRHVDDEQASVNDIEDTGLWDHTEFTKQLYQ